jgi:5-carboxymethyl-2-hydroxymuconate isomerase
MPQIRLEYSANLGAHVSLQALAAELHPMLVRVADTTVQACVSRAYRAEDYYVGEGGALHGFAHLTIGLLCCRSPAVVDEVGRPALALLTNTHAPDGVTLQTTVEVLDLPAETTSGICSRQRRRRYRAASPPRTGGPWRWV